MDRMSTDVASLRAEVVRLRMALGEAKARLHTATGRASTQQRPLDGPQYHTFCLAPREAGWVLEGRPADEPLPAFLKAETAVDALHRVRTRHDVVTFSTQVSDMEPSAGAMHVRLEPVVKEGALRWVVGAARPAEAPTDVSTAPSHAENLQGGSSKIMDLLPDSVTIVNTSHEIVYVNSATVRLLAADAPADLIGQTIWPFLHPDDLPDVLAHLNAPDRNRSVRYRILRLDGEERMVETVMVPILHQGEPAMLSTARDVSHEHHLQRALETTQDLFHHIFQSVPAALVLVRRTDDICVDANAAFGELTGLPSRDIIGTKLADGGFWEEPEKVASMLAAEADGVSPRPSYVHLRGADDERRVAVGTFESVMLRDTPHALGVLLDITDGERTRRQLLQISKAVESTSDGIALFDRSGKLTYQNAAFSRLLGTDSEELTRRASGLLGLIDDDAKAEAVADAMAEGRSWRGDLTLHTATDQQVPFALRADSVRDTNGMVIGLVWILTDISERHAVQQQLIAAKDRAEEVSRVKSAILTNITHEVRTPLTVILGFTSMMRKGIGPRYERFVDLIDRSGQRLLLTLDSMLDLAQLEAGTLELSPERVDLLEIIGSVMDTLKPLADQKDIAFRLRTEASAVPMWQDHRVLLRVLHNLMDNALKFTSEGEVVIRVHPPDDEGQVHVSVQDTGVGIDEAFLDRVFDEFTQESSGLERSHQGSGLGLTVSRRLITRVGGTIQVESVKGEGTTLHLTFPVNMEEPGSRDRATKPAA